MPRATSVSGTYIVDVTEANTSGHPDQQSTITKINQTWLASHTGPPASRSQEPAPTSVVIQSASSATAAAAPDAAEPHKNQREAGRVRRRHHARANQRHNSSRSTPMPTITWNTSAPRSPAAGPQARTCPSR